MKKLFPFFIFLVLILINFIPAMLLHGMFFCTVTNPSDPTQLGQKNASLLDRLDIQDSTLVLTAQSEGQVTVFALQRNPLFPRWKIQESASIAPVYEQQVWTTAARTAFSCYPYQVIHRTHLQQDGICDLSLQWTVLSRQYLPISLLLTLCEYFLFQLWHTKQHRTRE